MNDPAEWWRKRSPAFRLSVFYTLILVVISLVFSLSLYRLSVGQLEDSLRRQYVRFNPIENRLAPAPRPMQILDELEQGKRLLTVKLVYFNLLILLVGSGLSYALAKRTLEPIEDALEAQSRFTGDASHELRTPLTAMQTEIEVALRNKKVSKEDLVRLSQSNLEEIAKLRALSDGLLQLARNENGNIEFGPVEVGSIVKEALKRIQPIADHKQIKIIENTPELQVLGDQASLVDLVVILLDNAIKYSESGKDITVEAKKRPRSVEIKVSDQGHGLKASDLPHIFNRFYRADSSRAKSKTEGYGLGLSIAKKIVDLHHGSISAASTLGQGSTFIVRVPLAKVS